MKWTIVCAVLLIAVAAGTPDLSAQLDSQLEQLRLLQEREAATQAALQTEVAAAPEGYSFKQALTATAGASAAVQADPVKMKKLAAAMTAVKEDIMAKLREAQRESHWVKEVEAIVKQYKMKVKNVKKNLTKIRKDIKALIQKKRQIRNAQIQEQLHDRLTDANGDLKMVKDKLSSIRAQQKAFEKNRKKIATTIKKINAELKHLRGEKPKAKKPAAKKPAAKKPAAKKAAAKKAAGKKGAGKKAAGKKGKKGAKKGKKGAKGKKGKKGAKKGKKGGKKFAAAVKKACAASCKGNKDKACPKTCAKGIKACNKKCKKGDKKCKAACLKPKAKGKAAAKPAAKKALLETEAENDVDLLAEFAGAEL